MISHKHKCIFVHVPKAAGTSIERVFIDDLNLDMDNRHSLILGVNNNKNLGPRRVSHLLASEYVKDHYISQELFDSYFKFAFVRNPFTRLFSTYKFLGFDDLICFDGFIQKKLDSLFSSSEYGFFFKPAYDYLYDYNGNCLVDFVGKFENLNSDFKLAIETITFFKDSTSLKHVNKTTNDARNSLKKLSGKVIRMVDADHGKFTMSENSKDKVSSLYKNDLIFFGYSVE